MLPESISLGMPKGKGIWEYWVGSENLNLKGHYHQWDLTSSSHFCEDALNAGGIPDRIGSSLEKHEDRPLTSGNLSPRYVGAEGENMKLPQREDS